MITNKDRSNFIGASDTDRVVLSWNTKTFEKWWQEKTGLRRRNFSSDAMMTGNALEHRILDSISDKMIHDEQKIIGRLRVNLDARIDDVIYECKTYRKKTQKYQKPPKKHLRQVYVQMMAFGAKKAYIVAYALNDREYDNWYLPIDLERISLFEVSRDEGYRDFIKIYIPRLVYLEHCLDTGEYPTEEKFVLWAAARKK